MAGCAAGAAEDKLFAGCAIPLCRLWRARRGETAYKCDELPELHIFVVNARHQSAWNTIVNSFEQCRIGRSMAVFAACQIGTAAAFALQAVTFGAVRAVAAGARGHVVRRSVRVANLGAEHAGEQAKNQ